MKLKKTDIHYIYSENLRVMENQISSVKKMIQAKLGSLEWLKINKKNSPEIIRLKEEIFADTRLFTFLISSWFEARLKKIVYDRSSAAFNQVQIKQILDTNLKRTSMLKRWKLCFETAVCNGYKLNSYSKGKFKIKNVSLSEYNNVITIESLFIEIDEAIKIRNSLAHGEWHTQLNGTRDKVKQVSFFNKYSDVQKLDLLHNYYSIIAEVIESYVVYKNKNTNKFETHITTMINRLEQQKNKLANPNYENYVKPFLIKETTKRKRMSR